MGATEILLAEREALCETLETVGPTGPTLCEGWLAADLAAHLLVRETRLDALPGISLGGPFARHTQRLMEAAKERGFEAMVERLRNGPPFLHRLGPAARANVVENWIHHEDLRRAAGSAARPGEPEVEAILWSAIGTIGRLGVRRVRGAGIEVATPDGRTRVVTRTEPRVAVVGAAGELVLYLSGRKEAAEVRLDGPPEAVALVTAARFGL